MSQQKSEDAKVQYRFSTALWQHYNTGKIPVIPDIKLRSPGEGDLLQGRDPVEYAKALVSAGAPVLSVVTEPAHFGGSPELLQKIALGIPVPVLRKDFIRNKDQLLESIDLGASAILLIASILDKPQLFKLVDDALKMGLEPLVETHCAKEINNIYGLELTMIGINNRNIIDLETDNGCVDSTEKLAGLIRPGILIISESSISSPLEVKRAAKAGANAVLVGTAILQAADSVDMYNRLGKVEVESL